MAYKSSVSEKSEVDRQISIEIPRADYQQKFDKLLSQTASQARLKGFRPGRAPKAMVAKLYGEKIHGDVMSQLVSDAYRDALKEHELQVVGYPEINIDDEDKEKDLMVTADVSVVPDPSIEDVSGLSFEVQLEEYSEEEYERRLNGMAEQFAEMKPLEGDEQAKTGDLATVDFSGTVDGEPFPGSDGENIFIEIGSGRSIKEIEEGLVGMKLGEEKEVSATLSEESGEELAGKEAVYKVELKTLSEKNVPALDDELAKKTGVAEDLESLKDYVKKALETEVERKNELEREESLVKAIIEKNPFEIPNALIDDEIRNVLFEMGLLDPRDERSYQVDVARFRDNLGEPAGFRVKRSIIMDVLRKREGIEIEDEEVDAWLDNLAEKQEKTRDEINKMYNFPQSAPQLKNLIANEKIVAKLLDEAKIKEVKKESAEA